MIIAISLQNQLINPEYTFSQVIPDSTLGIESSVVNPINSENDRIDGGAIRGKNLFHSFYDFNVNEDKGVYFANPASIENIFTRVTGNHPSHILGRLGVLGGANLFFLNPNGILFGANATLDLKGSFSASTASNIVFEDRSFFSASNPSESILTSSIPTGLGFLNPTGKIQVEGTGHNLIQLPIPDTPNQFLNSPKTGLTVDAQRTINLAASQIIFNGGILTAPSGNIEVFGIDSGELTINWHNPYLFSIDYQVSQVTFNDLFLTRLSLLNASGTTNGNIQVVGKNILITDSSAIFIENQGSQALGSIKIQATGTLENFGITELSPIYPNFVRPGRGISSQARSEGKGSDIYILADQLILNSSGRIYTSQFAEGNAGDISIEVNKNVDILGVAPNDPNFLISSLIASASAGSGKSGSITVNSSSLSLHQGGFLSTIALGNGAGGDILLNADTILVEGLNKASFFPSLISANNQNTGLAGNVYVNAKYILVENGGRIDASNLALGRAGNLFITADIIEVKGKSPVSNAPSLITASASIPSELLQEGLSLPDIAEGTSGNLKILANQILVSNGASINVAHDGTGDGGILTIDAKSITLNNSLIAATSQAGLGGNISLTTDHDITLRGNSAISATAGGTGNGGNININSRFLILKNNSSITAQAFQGRGGNINLTVEGLLESPQSLISASSEFGVDGQVSIERSYKFEDALLIPNYDYLQIDEILDRFCNTSEPKGSFQTIGSGSLPPSPEEGLTSTDSLITIPKPSSQSIQPEPSEQTVIVRPEAKWKGGRIVEGNTRLRLPDGRIILIAVPDSLKISGDLACPASKPTPNN
ncbi:filamentous hemagglutinin N-terminal domain-containing protein [Chroococcus sp. FPU101]|uniref:two-partner secretion domain-containing protein n=1 Tax=Chroococcus sp. FPU101 TaxID=1974212 RepID=UPI001A8D4D30|nr:filamentous hemagglutinin N-terminal domain-containing protein [Chroococcus sp. FPU101]